jgi:hypothetical protein
MASSRYIRPSVLVIVALVLVVFAAPQARAILGDHFVNGYQLLQRCLNGDRKIETQLANQMAQALIDKGACYAYIEGVFDGSADDLPCSLSVTLGQVQTIVVNYLKTHPVELHLPAARLATTALEQALERDPDRLCKRLQQQ